MKANANIIEPVIEFKPIEITIVLETKQDAKNFLTFIDDNESDIPKELISIINFIRDKIQPIKTK